MKTDVVVQTAALSKLNGNNSLREGSSVYVRVIKNNGNNSYVVAFAGGRFAIKSDVQLKEGMGFLAKIKLSEGRVLLQMVEEHTSAKNPVEQLDSGGKKMFFQSLGLVPDQITFTLFNQMKALGAKLNANLFDKARKIGSNFKKKERQAAEIALLLEEKGITAEKETVQAILDDSESPESFEKSSRIIVAETVSPFKDFFLDILSGTSSINNTPGILTLFNHLGFNFEKPYTNGNWIKIPFEFAHKKLCGKGKFCAFIGNVSRSMEKAVVEFNAGESSFFFALVFKGSGLNEIKAGYSGNDEMALEKILSGLGSKFPEADISLFDKAEYTEFYAPDSEISIVRGIV